MIGGYDTAKNAYYELQSRTVDIKTLVTLAVGTIAIGEYWEAAAVVFLFSLGSYLEGRTMHKTRTALQKLLELTPNTALILYGGGMFELNAGRAHTQALASLFYPDSPNDLAPPAYHWFEPGQSLPRSPLDPPNNPSRIGWYS